MSKKKVEEESDESEIEEEIILSETDELQEDYEEQEDVEEEEEEEIELEIDEEDAEVDEPEEEVEETEDVLEDEEEEKEEEEKEFDDEDFDEDDGEHMDMDIEPEVVKNVKRKEFAIKKDQMDKVDETYKFRFLSNEEFTQHIEEVVHEKVNNEKLEKTILKMIFEKESKDQMLQVLMVLYQNDNIKEAVKQMKEQTDEFISPFWEEHKKIMLDEVSKLKTKDSIEAQEGDFVCPKCKGNKTKYFQVQLRSADEPMSIIIYCKSKGCGHKWRIG